MAEKDLHHRLTADSSSLEGGMRRGSRAMSEAEREARRLEQQQRKTHQAMDQVGRGMLVAGAAIAAGLALSVKAAIEWESAWAGVVKTVDGSPEQMAELEAEIRSLTAVLPATHTEIAAVAAAAGQLGIQRENITAFTKVMIDMGQATNLSADAAATALARFMNIMQTAPDNVDRLGSAIVDLGNNSATTEAEIVEMALRIAGAGASIGLTEAQVLAFSAALSSVGIAAEAGGTAISRAFLTIDAAVRNGGEELEAFAEVAGMTAEEFRQAYQDDAAGAIDAFVQGLGRIQRSGGDVNATLGELGLSEIRVSDALRRLSGSGDLLTRSLELGTEAWDENAALVAEAEQRYATTEARMAIARNEVNDFAISLGQVLLPAVGELTDRLSALATFLGGLPGPLQAALAVVGALAAGVLLLGGGLLVVTPRIAATKAALDQLAASSGRAAVAARALNTSLGAVGSFFAGPWGIALGVAVVALTSYAVAQANAKAKIQELSTTLDQQTGAVTANTRLWAANTLANREATGMFTLNGRQLNDFRSNLELTNISMATAVDATLGDVAALEELNRMLEEAKEREEETATAIGLSSSERGRAQSEAKSQRRAIEDIIEVILDENGNIEEAVELQKLLAEATEGTTEETQEFTPEVSRLADELGVSASAAEDVTEALDEMDKELKALFDSVFGLSNAKDELTDKFQELREQVEAATEAGDANASSLTANTEAARRNRAAAQELLEAYAALVIETLRNAGSQEEAEAAVRNFEDGLDNLEAQTGLNVREMEGYNDVVSEIERLIRVHFEARGTETAIQRVRRLQAEINALTGKTVHIGVTGAGVGAGGGFQEFQTGGWVRGQGSRPVMVRAHPREFVVRPEVAVRHAAALEALNATGQMPAATQAMSFTGRQPATSAAGGSVMVSNVFRSDGTRIGDMIKELTLDSLRTDASFRGQVADAVAMESTR